MVTVVVYDLIAEAAPVDEINCLNRPITIDASGSSQGNGISYNWTTKMDGLLETKNLNARCRYTWNLYIKNNWIIWV